VRSGLDASLLPYLVWMPWMILERKKEGEWRERLMCRGHWSRGSSSEQSSSDSEEGSGGESVAGLWWWAGGGGHLRNSAEMSYADGLFRTAIKPFISYCYLNA